jgi:hypothetical protein
VHVRSISSLRYAGTLARFEAIAISNSVAKLLCNLRVAGAELAPDCFVDIQSRPYQTKYWTDASYLWQGCKCSFNVQRSYLIRRFCLSSKNLHVTGHTNINIDWISAILKLRSNLPIILQACRSWKYDVLLAYVYAVNNIYRCRYTIRELRVAWVPPGRNAMRGSDE